MFKKLNTAAGTQWACYNVLNDLSQYRQRGSSWVKKQIEKAAVKVVLWALSNPEVRQQINYMIADQVEHELNNFQIEADDVRGLDRFISDQMSEVDADQIRGLDQAIEQEVGKAVEDALKDLVDDDQIAGAVLDELVKRIQNG